MRKNKRYRANHPRCKNCFWIPGCPIWAEHHVDPDICTEYLPFEVAYKKPNFWLYLAGEVGSLGLCLLFYYLSCKYDNPGGYFACGCLYVFSFDIFYEYQQRLRDYWRCFREVQKDV